MPRIDSTFLIVTFLLSAILMVQLNFHRTAILARLRQKVGKFLHLAPIQFFSIGCFSRSVTGANAHPLAATSPTGLNDWAHYQWNYKVQTTLDNASSQDAQTSHIRRSRTLKPWLRQVGASQRNCTSRTAHTDLNLHTSDYPVPPRPGLRINHRRIAFRVLADKA